MLLSVVKGGMVHGCLVRMFSGAGRVNEAASVDCVPYTTPWRWCAGLCDELGFVGHFLPDRWWERGLARFVRAPVAVQAAVAVATLHLAQKAAESGAAPFIYFQF